MYFPGRTGQLKSVRPTGICIRATSHHGKEIHGTKSKYKVFDNVENRRPVSCRNGRIDVADLTNTVSFMFGGGPLPDCLDEGDLKADCSIDIPDLTYRVA